MSTTQSREIPAADAPGRLVRWINLPALSAVLIWSALFPIAKYALEDFPVMAYTAIRPLAAAVLIFVLLKLRGEGIGVARRDWPRLLAGAFGGMAVFQVFLIVGLQKTSASHSALLVSSSPLLGAVVLWTLRQTRLGARAVLGLPLGFGGVALLVQGSGATRDATLQGDLLTLVAALGWVGVTVIPAPLVKTYGSVRVTGWLLLAAGVVATPIALGDFQKTIDDVPRLGAWLALVYGVVLGTITGNALWQRAVHKLGSTQTLVYLYLQPLVAVAIAAIFLGERLGWWQLAGGVLVLVGVGLVRQTEARAVS